MGLIEHTELLEYIAKLKDKSLPKWDMPKLAKTLEAYILSYCEIEEDIEHYIYIAQVEKEKVNAYKRILRKLKISELQFLSYNGGKLRDHVNNIKSMFRDDNKRRHSKSDVL